MPYVVLRPLLVFRGTGLYLDPTTRQVYWRTRRGLTRIWPFSRSIA